MNDKSLNNLSEIALVCGVVFSVLSFGGTEPVSFAAVEVLLFASAVWLTVKGGSPLFVRPSYLVVPALLALWALLQVCPLPRSLLRLFAGPRESYATSGVLSLAPYQTRVEILILLTCTVAFYFAVLVSGERQRKRRLIYALVALGTAEAFYGLIQYLANWQTIWWYSKKYDLEEATGTYINRNHLAGFLEMILPFAVCLALYEGERLTFGRTRHSRRRGRTGPGLAGVALWLTVAVVLMVALVFSRSRMGLLAACASLIVIFSLNVLQKRIVPVALSLAFVLLSLSLAAWLGLRPALTRFEGLGGELSSQETRLSIWPGTVKLISERPLIGNGLGTFPVAYTPYQKAFLTKFVNHAHNDYLEFASDFGIPVALVLFASILFVLIRSIRAFFWAESRFERNVSLACVGSIAAILLHSLTDFNLCIPANALVLAAILGIALASAANGTQAEANA